MMQSGSYYNTTAELSRLAEFIESAGRQDRAILRFFAEQQGRSFGPSKVYKGLIDAGVITAHTPITSVRRSITSLTTKGLLLKTKRSMQGLYGRPEMQWLLAPAYERQIVEQLQIFPALAGNRASAGSQQLTR